MIFTKKWWKAAGVRALRTFAQAAAAMIPTAVTITQVDWKAVIGTHALSTMTAAKEIVIPDGVEEICDNAINACDYCLEKVVIPASVTKIGSKMLAYGYGNTVLYVYAGSYAEQYAKDNNLRYEIIKEEIFR